MCHIKKKKSLKQKEALQSSGSRSAERPWASRAVFTDTERCPQIQDIFTLTHLFIQQVFGRQSIMCQVLF